MKQITLAQIRAEWEKYASPRKFNPTAEQKAFIKEAREHNVSFNKLALLWKSLGWGEVHRSTISEWARENL